MAEFNLQIGIDAKGARRGANEVKSALNGISQGGRKADKQLVKTEKNVDRLGKSLGRLKRLAITAFASFGAFRAGREFIELSDQYTQIENRLRLVTSSSEELSSVQAELVRQSKESFISLESQAQVFQRVSKGAGEFGFTQNQALQATEALAKAVRLSGVDAQSASSALIQLGQGIAAGALRGQELNSVLEQTPRVADALADALGVSVGQLKALGEAGSISVERIIPGLIEQLDKLNEETKKLTPTFDEITTNIRTDFLTEVGAFNKATQLVEGFGNGLRDVAEAAVPALFDQLAVLASGLITLSQQGATTIDFISESFLTVGESAVTASEGTGFFANSLANLSTPLQSAFTAIQLIIVDIVGAVDKLIERALALFNRLKAGIASVASVIQRVLGDEFQASLHDAQVVQLNKEFDGTADRIKAINDRVTETQAALIAQFEAGKLTTEQFKEQLRLSRERLAATKEENLAAIGDVRAGGRTGKVNVSPDKAAKKAATALAKFNEANDPAAAFAAEMAEIAKFSEMAGVSMDAVANATQKAVDAFAESQGIISQDDIDSFEQANNATAAYQAELDMIGKFAATGAVSTEALAEATRRATEAWQESQGLVTQTTIDEFNAANNAAIQYQNTLEEIAALEAAGADETAVANARKAAKERFDEASQNVDFLRDLSKAATEDIQGAFTDLFSGSLNSLDDFADSFGATLQRVAANFLANQAIQFLFGQGGLGSGGGPGGGGLIGMGVQAFAGLFADGGKIGSNEFGIVGEKGPELVSGPAAVTPMGGAMMAGPEVKVDVVNVQNNRDAIDALNTAEGDKAIMNSLRRNPGAFKRELGLA